VKVKQLINFLEDFDQDAEVLIVQQPAYPFEYKLKRILVRTDFEFVVPDTCYGKQVDDVLIVTGDQVRYGSKKCFENVD
jgi:hypothetical protein